MTTTDERLYNLLPAIYRLRDAEQGEPLRALLGLIETERQALESDIDGLYADWFIETAAEWVVPYIGDLLGVRGLNGASSSAFSLRAYVANTLAYRRRKGTATMLEQLARDVSGWDARVVEFFALLETSQHVNHVRLGNLRKPDLRDADALELLDTPFDRAAHSADLRHISNAGLRPGPVGRYNISNIGIFLWRLQAYTLELSDARAVGGGFTFNPLGLDQPLYNPPRSEAEITHLAEEINVPGTLRRRPLYSELEALRQSLAGGLPGSALYFDPDRPVFSVSVDGAATPIPPEQVLICDLRDWQIPPASLRYPEPGGTVMPIAVAVDPRLGRLRFPSGALHSQVRVSSAYGFSGDVGGGPYNRRESAFGALRGPVDWQVGVSHQNPPVAGQVFATLSEAVQAWNAQPAGTVGLIVLMDSSTYPENLTGPNVVTIPAGSQLSIVSAGWPLEEDPLSPGVFIRTRGEMTPDGVRAHLLGSLSVRGLAPTNDPNPGGLVIDGLLIEGRLSVLAGNLGSLQINHTTLAPAKGGLQVNSAAQSGAQNALLAVSLARSICGPLLLADSVPNLSLSESILDGASQPGALSCAGTDARLESCTVFGTVSLRSLEASNTIFNGVVSVQRRQAGCLRYSFVPDGSQTPRHYRCQPDLALIQRAAELGFLDSAGQGIPDQLPGVERACVISRVKPAFRSDSYPDPDTAQLSRSSDPGILTGAEDGSEMGVFNFLKQPQRENNLRASLDEYLRFGLEAGIFFVS